MVVPFAPLAWVASAAALGFGVAWVFSDLLEMPRPWYLLVYVGVITPFLRAYLRWTGVDLLAVLMRRWQWAVLVGGVFGVFLVMRMLDEPSSPRPQGLELVGDILWLGVVYGVVDALLLSVLPISAAWLGFRAHGWTSTWTGKAAAVIVGMVASMLVTAAYHAGYAEYRGEDLLDPVVGNGVMSLSYLLTANPISAVIAHVAMHIASVLHGIDTTTTLPPHY
jgi:hypothetical protein